MKIQSSQRKTSDSHRSKKARRSKSSVKVVLVLFLFIMRAIRFRSKLNKRKTLKFTWGRTATFVKRSTEKETRKSDQWVPPSSLAREFWGQNNVPVCPHPPYSTDSAQCEFWLFTKIKIVLNENFDTIPVIERSIDGEAEGSSERSLPVKVHH